MSDFSWTIDFFSVSPQKLKKLQELVVSSYLLVGFICLRVVPGLASNCSQGASWKCSSGLKTEAPEFVSLCLFIQVVIQPKWDFVFRVLEAVAGPGPWQPCWINSFQMAGLKYEKRAEIKTYYWPNASLRWRRIFDRDVLWIHPFFIPVTRIVWSWGIME